MEKRERGEGADGYAGGAMQINPERLTSRLVHAAWPGFGAWRI
jgi:hypothetical protein